MQSFPLACRLAVGAITLSLLLGVSAVGAQAQTAPAYHSPFNGEKPGDSTEAREFEALMKLYDAMKDAEAALKTAQLCGSGANGAQAALNAATKAFQDAFDEYVVGWSQNGPHLADYLRNHAYLHKSGRDYQEDARKLLDELARQDKKQHLVGACLPAPGATTPPTDGATPLGPCTTMSQAEIDAAIEKATNQLLNAMRWLRKFDDAVIRDIAAINSWNSRMGKAGDDRLSELKANLKRDSFGLDVITRERDDDVQKLRALKALKPCPAGAQPTPQSDKPQTPPAKPKSDSDADERPEIGALPPARKDSGFLGEVLGHVSFGFGIGGGRSDHGHRPISSRTPGNSDDAAPVSRDSRATD